MRISICPGCGFPVSTEIWPFAGVNFTPFLIRFQKSCCRRAESPCTKSSSASNFRSTRSDFCEIPSRQISSARCNTSWMLIGSRLSLSFPLAMRVTSSKSSINRASNSTLRRITSSARRTSGDSATWASSSATIAITGDRGLRNSCESNARNWSFAAFAPNNSLRKVMSRVFSSIR